MSNRKKTSGGQAIVLVSLALFSMAGMMGLAVDLGWSFFTQKAAQAAADDAALSAVQRAYKTIVSEEVFVTVFSFCSDTSDVVCKPTPVSCDPTNANLGNLQSACLYARNDGFTPGGHGGRQNVLIQANRPPAFPDSIPAVPGSPRDMVYWVTVRTNENIPQLFSAVMGHTQGTISAVATAAIANKTLTGSFWGMNHKSDCTFDGSLTAFNNCGVDVDASGHARACSASAGAPTAYLCAPDGVVLASSCNGATTGCSGYAGDAPSVYGGGSIQVYGSGGVKTPQDWTPAPIDTASPKVEADPLKGVPQPPVAATAAGPISSCGYLGGNGIPSNATLGPNQYYSYHLANGVKIPDGAVISLPGTVTFSPTATGAAGCPGGVYTAGGNQSSAFPSYIFYGGLDAGGTVNFGAGQYVMAGTVNSGGTVLSSKNSTIGMADGNTTGVMIVLTDANYPGLATQVTNVPNYNSGGSALNPASPVLFQGTVDMKNTDITLSGLNKTDLAASVPALSQYNGIVIWQDRANSTVEYNKAGPTNACAACTKDDGTVVYCNDCSNGAATVAMYNENRVTPSSPELKLNDGNGSAVLTGAIYQPRGAWFTVNPGNFGVDTSPLQLITGALLGGGGNTNITLWSPTNSLVTYLPVLIQ
jgi:Putative Flp pilus-assembly TadE/G-like